MRFAFEDYMLDAGRRELTHRSAQVAVGPQVFDLLFFLVRNRERVLSKDDLLQAVWGGRIVSELTLTSHINAVRKAIGDNGQAQHLIRTVARKGFRFVGEVTEEGAAWTMQHRSNLNQPTRMKIPSDPRRCRTDPPSPFCRS